MIDLSSATGFNWDDGNARKNEKHGVSMAEAEQVFFNAPLLLLEDAAHSPGGHFKFPHLWPVKFLQAGRLNYETLEVSRAMRAAASLRR